jgi:hypothetical protein
MSGDAIFSQRPTFFFARRCIETPDSAVAGFSAVP